MGRSEGDPRTHRTNVQELVLESARVIAEALADSVVPVMARLTRTYKTEGRAADTFFRGMRRLLTDFTEEEFVSFRELILRVHGIGFELPWVEVELTGRFTENRMNLNPDAPATLQCSDTNMSDGEMTQSGPHVLGEAPSHVSRLLHLLQVNNLANPGLQRFGASLPISALIRVETLRRIHAVVY